MAVGYTALLIDHDTQRMLRETYGAHPATPVTTPRIVDRLHAVRGDKRAAAPQDVRIVGVHENAQIKVLLLEVGGAITRADGGFYTIPLFMPGAGLHIKTMDELAQALLAGVPAQDLRNHATDTPLAVRPAFVVGVERPQAAIAEPARAVRPAISRFMRAG